MNVSLFYLVYRKTKLEELLDHPEKAPLLNFVYQSKELILLELRIKIVEFGKTRMEQCAMLILFPSLAVNIAELLF